MTTNNGSQFQGVQGKVMEAMSAFAQANERVIGELIDLSSTAAREGLRAIGELQAAAMETARGFQMPGMPQPETLEDLRRDPFAWYRKGVQALADSAQRAAKLAETNVQIVTRNMERMQASADHAAREIEQATSGYVSRMKDIYTK
jgi:flagellar motor component MotA